MIDQNQLKAFALENKHGRAIWHMGALLIFKAVSEETNGQYWAFEGLADRSLAVPMHVHHREDEFWYILDGEVRFFIGDEMRSAGPGSFAYVPRGVSHSFQIRSETARWLGVGIPSGFDYWFFETGQPAESLTLPPSSIAKPSIDVLVASLKAYGTDTLGPPPANN